jgi:hypothetical protein
MPWLDEDIINIVIFFTGLRGSNLYSVCMSVSYILRSMQRGDRMK